MQQPILESNSILIDSATNTNSNKSNINSHNATLDFTSGAVEYHDKDGKTHKSNISMERVKNVEIELSYSKLGIILAAGKNSRMFPASMYTSKSIIPVYEKPAIYYAIAQLFSCGVSDIVIVANSTNYDIMNLVATYFSKGKVHIHIVQQIHPTGVIDAVYTALAYIRDNEYLDIDTSSRIYLYFADNIYVRRHYDIARMVDKQPYSDISLLVHYTSTPEKFGIIYEANGRGEVRKYHIEEKPQIRPSWASNPTSYDGNKGGIAVTGFYVYSNRNDIFINIIKSFYENKKSSQYSDRSNRYTITDLNNAYLHDKNCNVNLNLISGFDEKNRCWFDAGIAEGLSEATSAIKEYQENEDLIIGYPEVEGSKKGFFDIENDFAELFDHNYMNSSYVKNIIEYIRFLRKYK